MTYFVLTVRGRITKSIPELPIPLEHLNWVNTSDGRRVVDRLSQVMPNLIDCQILADKINWGTDTVLHILTQQ